MIGLVVLGAALATWRICTARPLSEISEELSTTANDPLGTRMVFMMMAVRVGFAVAYVF